jgi:hypothetical protein
VARSSCAFRGARLFGHAPHFFGSGMTSLRDMSLHRNGLAAVVRKLRAAASSRAARGR